MANYLGAEIRLQSDPHEGREGARDRSARGCSRERIAGRRYLIGDGLTALDIYWATFANLILPLPEADLPAIPMIRAAYTCHDADILGAVSDELRALQRRIYETHLELPVPL